METAIGIAREIAKIQLPSLVVQGGAGGGNGSNSDLGEVLGLNALLDLQNKIIDIRNKTNK